MVPWFGNCWLVVLAAKQAQNLVAAFRYADAGVVAKVQTCAIPMLVDVGDPRSLNQDRSRRLRAHNPVQPDEVVFHFPFASSRRRSFVDGQKKRPGGGGRWASER